MRFFFFFLLLFFFESYGLRFAFPLRMLEHSVEYKRPDPALLFHFAESNGTDSEFAESLEGAESSLGQDGLGRYRKMYNKKKNIVSLYSKADKGFWFTKTLSIFFQKVILFAKNKYAICGASRLNL